jgi:hypothetical protein
MKSTLSCALTPSYSSNMSSNIRFLRRSVVMTSVREFRVNPRTSKALLRSPYNFVYSPSCLSSVSAGKCLLKIPQREGCRFKHFVSIFRDAYSKDVCWAMSNSVSSPCLAHKYSTHVIARKSTPKSPSGRFVASCRMTASYLANIL